MTLDEIDDDMIYGNGWSFDQQTIDDLGVDWQGRDVRPISDNATDRITHQALKHFPETSLNDVFPKWPQNIEKVHAKSWRVGVEDEADDDNWGEAIEAEYDEWERGWGYEDEGEIIAAADDVETPFEEEGEEEGLSEQDYSQKIADLEKEIEKDPGNPQLYRERGIAYFHLGQYERSLEDYKHVSSLTEGAPFLSLKENAVFVAHFARGFAKGLPEGVYESGKGLMLFLVDFVKHPIQTSGQVFEALSTVASLGFSGQWDLVAHSICPELCQIANSTYWYDKDWRDHRVLERLGEYTGHVFGKYGTDILLPGAIAKAASKGVKNGRTLAASLKNLKKAQETLLFETAAEIGNSAKIAEVVQSGKTTAFLAEELGLTGPEMGQLKQTGKLGGAINIGLEKLVSQSESEVYKAAISQNKHVKMVRDYLDKPAKEIQKGVSSYEKQIALHRDKILNPAKHCPDWNKLDPRQREALVNKKWPAEIQVYEEQRSVLQSILNERVSHE